MAPRGRDLIAGFAVFGFPFMTWCRCLRATCSEVGAPGYAALVSAIGLGAAAGALTGRISENGIRKERLLMVGSSLFGVTLACIAGGEQLPASLALFTVAGWTMAAERHSG